MNAMKGRHLSLKQKIILILIFHALAIATLGSVSYDDLNTVGRKLEVVELADNLNRVILEIRRYEKNYLLYHKYQDLEENANYVTQALSLVDAITPRIKYLRSQPQLNALLTKILEYQHLMRQLSRIHGASDDPAEAKLIGEVREAGQRMLEITEQEVAFERMMIRNILQTLKVQLFSVLGVALALGAFLPFLAFRKFFKLLHLMRQTTANITAGRIERIPIAASEDEMRRLMEAFNHMVQELERQQAQLIQTQKLSSLGTLAAGVAHQLNNPLNNISTSCQIALDELSDGDPAFLQQMLNNIDQETIRARDIVKGLLEFSRIKVFSLRQVSVNDMVNRTLTLISSDLPAGIEIQREIPESLLLDGDAQRLQEVLLNLLLNSVQAIGDRPGRIGIRAWEDAAAGQAVIAIQDNGSGIAPAILGRIFDPFFTTKENGQGTGLGLSIAYGIIKQHQGSISVQSQEGSGTTFTIRLPLREVAQQNERSSL